MNNYQIRPELKEKIKAIKDEDDEAEVVIRSLHRLYFASKATANPAERGFLLGEGFLHAAQVGLTQEQDREIFADERKRHYSQASQ